MTINDMTWNELNNLNQVAKKELIEEKYMILLHYNGLKVLSECYICNQGPKKTPNNNASQNYKEKITVVLTTSKKAYVHTKLWHETWMSPKAILPSNFSECGYVAERAEKSMESHQ